MPLTELLLRHLCGLPIPSLQREQAASGAMMLPIPQAGFFKQVDGLEEAFRVPGIEDIVITATPGEQLTPFPEGSGYPGFLFARAGTPQEVERALRTAHRHLKLRLTPSLALV